MARGIPGESRERIYRFVRDRLLRGAPPTVREVQSAFGFRSVESAREHLDALVAEGRLAKDAGRSRGFRLPEETPVPRLVPILGRVPAGPLATAIEELEGYVPFASRRGGAGSSGARGSTPREDELFALRVRGDSMTGAGILEGDLVIVRRQESAETGDIVVALVGDDATVKRLRLRRGRVELHAENPAYPPIVPDPTLDPIRIAGKVIEVRRHFEDPGFAVG